MYGSVEMDWTDSKWNEDMANTLIAYFKCPVCLETPSGGPIYNCANGHMLCGMCRERQLRILKAEVVARRENPWLLNGGRGPGVPVRPIQGLPVGPIQPSATTNFGQGFPQGPQPPTPFGQPSRFPSFFGSPATFRDVPIHRVEPTPRRGRGGRRHRDIGNHRFFEVPSRIPHGPLIPTGALPFVGSHEVPPPGDRGRRLFPPAATERPADLEEQGNPVFLRRQERLRKESEVKVLCPVCRDDHVERNKHGEKLRTQAFKVLEQARKDPGPPLAADKVESCLAARQQEAVVDTSSPEEDKLPVEEEVRMKLPILVEKDSKSPEDQPQEISQFSEAPALVVAEEDQLKENSTPKEEMAETETGFWIRESLMEDVKAWIEKCEKLASQKQTVDVVSHTATKPIENE